MIGVSAPRRTLAAATALVSLAVVTTAVATTTGDKRDDASRATAKLRAPDGRGVGTVVMRQRGAKVTVSVRARGLTPGFHGFHVHEKGACEAPSQSPDGKTGAFLSAGGHVRTGSQVHGGHDGDMPPLFALRNGTARATFVTDAFDVTQLAEGDGSAAMIHAGADNLANIPARYTSGGQTGPDEETEKTGDAGDRAACGVVRLKRR